MRAQRIYVMTVHPSLLIGAAAIFFAAGCASTRPPGEPGEQVPDAFEAEIERTVGARYNLFLPEGYGNGQDWPLLIFLHGAGERGNDLALVKAHGPPRLVEERPADFPFVVVSPQAPEGGWWEPDVVAALTRHITDAYDVDERRVYLTGLSMGGFGTWETAARYPELYAAAVPICGGGTRRLARGMTEVPVWAFHGDADEVVPLERTTEMVEALRAAGGDVKLTVYPGVGHDSWTETYDNPELYRWLLEQHK